jgi:hypothetical protein
LVVEKSSSLKKLKRKDEDSKKRKKQRKIAAKRRDESDRTPEYHLSKQEKLIINGKIRIDSKDDL